MAKFTKHGYIAKSKNNPDKRNLVLEKDGVKTYFILSPKPTPEQVEANPNLAKIVETWPDWKIADVLKIEE